MTHSQLIQKTPAKEEKPFTFTYDRSQNKRCLIVKSFWSFTVVNLKSTLSVVVERFLKFWCPANRVHFGEFSLSKANKVFLTETFSALFEL